MPGVMKALGLKKDKQPKESVPDAARRSSQPLGAGRIATAAELEQQLKLLEKVSAKLGKAHRAGNRDSQDAAFQVKAAAERIYANMDPLVVMLGPKFVPNRKRLQKIIDDNQIIWDEHLVEQTKKKAGAAYLQAGREAVGVAQEGKEAVQGPRTQHGLAHLSQAAKVTGFGGDAHEEMAGGGVLSAHAKTIEAAGKALGLSSAEVAAINTFTNTDYHYINPATANSTEWMKAANPDARYPFLDKKEEDRTADETAALKKSFADADASMAQRLTQRDEEAASRRLEGALHAGVAMQGLMKLKVWPGKVYRGEVLNQKDFDAKFEKGKKDRNGRDQYKIRATTFNRNTITSASKQKKVATDFWAIAGREIDPPRYNILYEWDLKNGRDIEMFSNSPAEKEVAILPGAELKVTSSEAQYHPLGSFICVFVKAKQVR